MGANITFIILFVISPFVAMCGIVYLATHRAKEGLNDGRDRKAEADSQHPDPGEEEDDYTGSSTLPVARVAFDARTGTYSLQPWHKQDVKEVASDVESQMERVESDMPILAHRSAKLLFTNPATPFGSVTQNIPFGVDTEAECSTTSHYRVGTYRMPDSGWYYHRAPAVDCSCGFYALPPDIEPTYLDAAYVTLMVELSGKVIEHEKGFRAQHQRVIACEIPLCWYCGREADWLTINKAVLYHITCAAHRPAPAAGDVYLHVDDLRLPVPVTRKSRVN